MKSAGVRYRNSKMGYFSKSKNKVPLNHGSLNISKFLWTSMFEPLTLIVSG
jgi:hypothetical protein